MVTVDQKQSQSAHDLTLAPWPERRCQKARRQEPREGKAASEAEGRSPGTWWKREREDALAVTELPQSGLGDGCGPTTSRL